MAIAGWLFCPVGAFVFWAIKGFKGSFKDEFNEEKSVRNYFAGIGAEAAIILIATSIFN